MKTLEKYAGTFKIHGVITKLCRAFEQADVNHAFFILAAGFCIGVIQAGKLRHILRQHFKLGAQLIIFQDTE